LFNFVNADIIAANLNFYDKNIYFAKNGVNLFIYLFLSFYVYNLFSKSTFNFRYILSLKNLKYKSYFGVNLYLTNLDLYSERLIKGFSNYFLFVKRRIINYFKIYFNLFAIAFNFVISLLEVLIKTTNFLISELIFFTIYFLKLLFLNQLSVFKIFINIFKSRNNTSKNISLNNYIKTFF